MQATEDLSQLTYQVVGKGDVIVSEVVKVPNTKKFQFEFTPTLAMVPKSNVIVFYIRENGEIVSDSTKIEFENELPNSVSFIHKKYLFTQILILEHLD